jgi:cobaltochelatase CobS
MKIVPYEIGKTFGIPGWRPGAVVPGAEPGLPGVPGIDPEYVFEKDTLTEMVIFWAGGFRALAIEGDPSAGKTSLAAQFHARVNWPMGLVACSPSTETYQLMGQLLPDADGKLRWVDGPVLAACRNGTTVVLDEYNTLDPGVATSINALLEGYAITIPETGEVVVPQRTTRVIVTQNPVDSRAAVAGRNVQDVANEDRFMVLRARYLRPEAEAALVTRHLMMAGVPEETARTMAKVTVEVANQVRQLFRDGTANIDKPLSTRAVLRWAKLSVLYTKALAAERRSGLHAALSRAVPMSADMIAATTELVTAVAGFDENLQSTP